MGAANYYVLLNDEVKGPFSMEQLRSMWNARAITRDTLYCEEGYEKWLPLSFIADQLEGESTSSTSYPSPPPIPRTAAPVAPLAAKTSVVARVVGVCGLGIIVFVSLLVIFDSLDGGNTGVRTGASASKMPPGPDVEVSQLKAELLGYDAGKFSYMEITGTIENRRSFALTGLLVRMSVVDDGGSKTDEALASVSSLDGGRTWKFKARTSEVGVCQVEGVWCNGGKLRAVFPGGELCKFK